jgi:predicted HAD superfamily phosphohydrolase YqeG
VCEGRKPLTKGYRQAIRQLGLNADNVAAVGDQIFTDILGANLTGIKSFYVAPIKYEETAFFKFKRTMEIPFIPKKFVNRENR